MHVIPSKSKYLPAFLNAGRIKGDMKLGAQERCHDDQQGAITRRNNGDDTQAAAMTYVLVNLLAHSYKTVDKVIQAIEYEVLV
jgi:hypothetical protein